MLTDDDRRNLYDALEAQLGPRPAATLMALLPPVGWADVATRSDVEALGTSMRGEMAELRAEVRTQLPKLIAANIASMMGVAGLMLAAFSIAH